MQLKSISRRVYRTMLAVSAVSMIAMVVTVLLVNEDLEHTMLEVEFAQERDFLLMNYTKDEVLVWDTPNLIAVFVPSGKPHPKKLPPIFRELPDKYSAEVKLGTETYLVTVNTVETGLLYIAKNITHFEDREALFKIALAIMTLVIISFSLALAVVSSRRIVRPLKLLSERISRIPVGANMPRMETDYVDAELHSIAMTFNRFLDELESYVQREQSLLNLASHELRTPIAVMSGALDILEQRGQLAPSDQATLKRVRRSCDEMRDNVDALLKLARRNPADQAQETLDVSSIVRQIIEDLKVSHHAGDRITLEVQASLIINTAPVMARMLLRNLMQNAVQHTQSNVRVTIYEDAIEIEDQGVGLNSEQLAILQGQRKIAAGESTLTGLGLYIVTLMTERLAWYLDIEQNDNNGTKIRLTPSVERRQSKTKRVQPCYRPNT